MPQGTIKDPRMNPAEHRFGTVEESVSSYMYEYEKTDEVRHLTAGTPVEIVEYHQNGTVSIVPLFSDEELREVHPMIAALNNEAKRRLAILEKKGKKFKPYKWEDIEDKKP